MLAFLNARHEVEYRTLQAEGAQGGWTVNGKPVSGAKTLEDVVFNLRVRGAEYSLLITDPIVRPPTPPSIKKIKMSAIATFATPFVDSTDTGTRATKSSSGTGHEYEYQAAVDAQAQTSIEVKRAFFLQTIEIGEGQFGSVYQGFDTRTDTPVAIKMLKKCVACAVAWHDVTCAIQGDR